MISEIQRYILSSKQCGVNPVDVLETEDPAVEKEISLSNLVALLEKIKGRDFPRTIFFAITVSYSDIKLPPGKEEVLKGLSTLKKMFYDKTEPQCGDNPFYDVIGLAYLNERLRAGEKSPYTTLYPAPAFMEGALDNTYYSRESLVKYLLAGDYADRVIYLPRLRYRGGDMFWDMSAMFNALIQEGPPVNKSRGILDCDSEYDLANIPDEVLAKIGIPVWKLENNRVILRTLF
jgi:hypothetical protein